MQRNSQVDYGSYDPIQIFPVACACIRQWQEWYFLDWKWNYRTGLVSDSRRLKSFSSMRLVRRTTGGPKIYFPRNISGGAQASSCILGDELPNNGKFSCQLNEQHFCGYDNGLNTFRCLDQTPFFPKSLLFIFLNSQNSCEPNTTHFHFCLEVLASGMCQKGLGLVLSSVPSRTKINYSFCIYICIYIYKNTMSNSCQMEWLDLKFSMAERWHWTHLFSSFLISLAS